MPGARLKRRLAAIMMAGVAGYGRLMEANDERTLAALRRHHREFLDPTIAEHGGRLFKDMGDAFLVEFASAVDAVDCAVAMQRGMAGRNAGMPEDRHIRLRIGINLGDVIVDGEDLYGDDINIAARLVELAQPGNVICSAGIRHQVGSKLNLSFQNLGEKELKNISPAVQVYLVDPQAMRVNGGTGKPPGVLRPSGEKPSVGVLPFINMSGDPEQDYFSDGITEDIITDLSKASELFVLSRNAVFRHKDSHDNLERIAAELGVAFLVHGNVRKAGPRVRISAQLTEGGGGREIWADRYDRDMTDIFEVQDEITRAIVEQLKVKLLPGERQAIEQAPTNSVEAYTNYLKGREFFHRGSKSNYLMAKMMFNKAIEIDPGFARAFAGMADCDAFLFMDYSEDVAGEVLRNSEKALVLNPGLIEARASRGLALSIAGRFGEAEAEFERAMAQDPSHFETLFFHGRACYAQGKMEQTALLWERAAEVKPDDFQALILLNQVYVALGRPDAAATSSVRGIERAEQEFARNPHNPRPAYFIATALAKLGETERAEYWAEKALSIAPDDYLTQYNIACFYSVRGKTDEAFQVLGRLIPVSNDDMRRWIATDTDFAPLHNDPRWRQIRLQTESHYRPQASGVSLPAS